MFGTGLGALEAVRSLEVRPSSTLAAQTSSALGLGCSGVFAAAAAAAGMGLDCGAAGAVTAERGGHGWHDKREGPGAGTAGTLTMEGIQKGLPA